MISRRTTLLIADIICNNFTHEVRKICLNGHTRNYAEEVIEDKLRDFLFEFGVDGFTINKLSHSYITKKDLKKFILNMHTGYFYNREEYFKFIKMGQNDIKKFAIGILYRRLQPESLEMLENLLRIDGYIYENEKLYEINIDTDDKVNMIKNKFEKLKFNNQDAFDKFYTNMNEHFENSKWEDSIHNCRKLYEIVLKECAIYYSKNIIKDNEDLSAAKPVEIRKYLEEHSYFSEDESNIIHYYYKYLSNIGSHPKLALEEQADFCRVMSINTILYVINRLEKSI